MFKERKPGWMLRELRIEWQKTLERSLHKADNYWKSPKCQVEEPVQRALALLELTDDSLATYPEFLAREARITPTRG